MGVLIQISGVNGPNRFLRRWREVKSKISFILLFLYVEYKELFNGVDACIEARCWM